MIASQTRVILLQHPRERDVAIGTARMASLCLPNSELLVGFDWERSATLDRALSDPARRAVLLYPGEGASNVLDAPPEGPVTLVVVDGTWSLTKKLIKHNPRLAALPRVAFRPPNPSEYRIRREPGVDCVSTLEALVHVLGALEGDAARFRPMLAPFRTMIDRQIACEAARPSPRSRFGRTPGAPRPEPAPPLTKATQGLVLVAAEANAWPSRKEGPQHPHELVHWVACRLDDGAVFERFVRPRAPLAPATLSQTELTEAQLDQGVTVEAFWQAFMAFVPPGGTLASWGDYPSTLLANAGLTSPTPWRDLRKLCRTIEKDKVGTAAAYLARKGLDAPQAPIGHGRSGRRLAEVNAVTAWLSRAADVDSVHIARPQ